MYRLILKVVFKKANSTKQKASVDISRYSKLDKLIGVLLSGFKIKINEIDDYSVYSSVARLEGKDLMSEDQDQKLTLEELRLEDFSTMFVLLFLIFELF